MKRALSLLWVNLLRTGHGSRFDPNRTLGTSGLGLRDRGQPSDRTDDLVLPRV